MCSSEKKMVVGVTSQRKKMQILDHNLKAYKALIKSFKKANRAYQLIFLLFCFIVLLF